jgi:hypothetical protein
MWRGRGIDKGLGFTGHSRRNALLYALRNNLLPRFPKLQSTLLPFTT